MEDPTPTAADPHGNEDEEQERRRRRQEELEEMERLFLMEQEAADAAAARDNNDQDHDEHPHLHHHHGQNEHVNDDLHPNQNDNENDPALQQLQNNKSLSSTKLLTYANVSFGAAFALLWYAYRTRQQYYLALTYISSSKYAYIILGNAMICSCMVLFDTIVKVFLTNLRLMEREGLSDFCRWNITETCLALTMFRSELNVVSGIYFLFLVLAKCLHWVVEQRESHLRMTQDAIIIMHGNGNGNGGHDMTHGEDTGENADAAPNRQGQRAAGAGGAARLSWWKRLPTLNRNQVGLLGLLQLLLMLDCIAVVCCIQHVATHGPSVHLFFGFETAILLVSCLSLLVLTNLHILDGIFHYCHDVLGWSNFYMAWKDRKAMLIFAMEVQAQGAKFLFYCAFFGIVFTYYGLPINLFREVYVSFQQLKSRFLAFTKYRKLVQGMNRFPSPTEPPVDACIICRDDMHIHDSKVLACGHLFHTACLRDWLVQQQSCPTCRGDISAMEATRRRQEQQDEAVAVAAADAEAQAEGATEAETASAEMPAAAAAAQHGSDDMKTKLSREIRTEPPLGDEGDSLSDVMKRHIELRRQARQKSAPSMDLKPLGKVYNEPIDLRPSAGAAANTNTKSATSLMFPALYKIISSPDGTDSAISTLGAPVYSLAKDTRVHVDGGGGVNGSTTNTINGYHKVRYIAPGTAVLCLEMELQTLGEELGLMLRLPNQEWVWEHDVEYLTHLPSNITK